MSVRVAINGFGRIGRNIMRAHFERGDDALSFVACNDLGEPSVHAHLFQYDTTHGPFRGDVSLSGDTMTVNGQAIRFLSERDPGKLPWDALGVDVVLECTGLFAKRDKAAAHLKAGAKKVVISAPAGNGVDATIVYGVNHETLTSDHQIISNASCTTNCLAPMIQALHEPLGVVHGLMTTIHAYTNDQQLTDVYHPDLRRARSATQSMIPTKTGAAAAVGLVLPEMAGKLDGLAIRVPTLNVSLVDLSFVASRETTVDEVNALLQSAATGPLAGVMAINERPLVSMDFNHNPASSIVDITQTKVIDRLVKVFSWYDNEWGFSNRMLDTTLALMAAA